MPRAGRPALGRTAAAIAVVAVVVLCGLGSSGGATAASYTALPIFTGNHLLGNLSGPALLAGSSGSLGLTVQDLLAFPMTGVVLTLDIYAQASGAGPASPLGNALAPVLTGTNGLSGSNITFPLPSLQHGQYAIVTVPVSTSSSMPATTYLIRTALGFVANGTHYFLESRGWFNAALWENATELPNGSATLNLAKLGVSGVTPESSIIVQTSTFAWAIVVLIVVALVFAGLGTFFYFRRSRSRAGAKRSPAASQAPKALGNKRKRDGD